MKKIIKDMEEYFLTSKLYIDNNKLNHNFYFFKEEKSEIESFTHDDAINDWIIEKVRIFNMSTYYLVNSIEKMIFLWNNKENVEEFLLRMEIRNTCINIEMYIDKIKSLIGYYFFLNEKAIGDGKEFLKALNQFDFMSDIIKTFILNCKKLYQDSKYKWIKDIRIAEIHNESLIERHNYEFSPDSSQLVIIDKGYKIDSEIIIDNIQYVLNLLYVIKENVQKILETIPNYRIYKHIKDTTGLKNILIPGNRANINKRIIVKPE